MPKPIVQIRNARIEPASKYGGRIQDSMVLVGDLASKHPVLGAPVAGEEGINRIVTSLIVSQRLSSREVETLNTIYQLVD